MFFRTFVAKVVVGKICEIVLILLDWEPNEVGSLKFKRQNIKADVSPKRLVSKFVKSALRTNRYTTYHFDGIILCKELVARHWLKENNRSQIC